jgi:hypothetical protein
MENGNIGVDRCSSILVNNFSDGACSSILDPIEFSSICGKFGPGITDVSKGEICFDSAEQAGLGFLNQQTKDKEKNRSYYEGLIPPPDDQCKCYISVMNSSLENKTVSNFTQCQDIMNIVEQNYYGGDNFSYGDSIVASAANNACKVYFSQVKEIIADNSELDKYKIEFQTNDDYQKYATSVCIQKVRDLHSITKIFINSYFVDANVKTSDGTILKESEFTKWNGATIATCSKEVPDYK